MEQFKEVYFARCTEYSIEPLPVIVKLLKESKSKGSGFSETLDLSGVSLSLKSCSAIAAALVNNEFFTKLILADTFLGDDGCIKITNALKSNSSIKYLDLRGNSIRSDGAVAIGQLLKVNNTLEELFLEWNCLGIWDIGMKSIAEALSINDTLTSIDLRNNKIGPQAVQSLAIHLKQNTSLKRIGLVGGRALLDLLKWNRNITELEIAGNEVPDDLCKAISAAVDRNRDRWHHDIHTKAHAETLACTIQSLTQSHKESMNDLELKYSRETKEREHLNGKLSLATSEIENMHEAYRIYQARVDRLEQQLKTDEEKMIKERSDMQNYMNDLQKELMQERDRRIKIEENHQKFVSEANERHLLLTSKLKKAELDAEVYLKDKNSLLEDLNQAKEKERSLSQLWEEKYQRLEESYRTKNLGMLESKEREYNDKLEKLKSRHQKYEREQQDHEQEMDNHKAKFLAEKRNWMEKFNEIESRTRREEELKRSELEERLRQLISQRDGLQSELEKMTKRMNSVKNDRDDELENFRQSSLKAASDLQEAQRKISKLQTELNNLNVKLESTFELEKELHQKKVEISKLEEAFSSNKKEVEKLMQLLQQRNIMITRLKEQIRKRDEELDASEEANVMRMKELQLSINSLLAARAKRQQRTASSEIDMS